MMNCVRYLAMPSSFGENGLFPMVEIPLILIITAKHSIIS